MLGLKFLVTAFALAGSAVATPLRGKPTKLPPHDGQYIHPNASNEAVEWWWAQAIADPVGNNPPQAFQLIFYQGYAFQFGPRDPSQPEFYLSINGFFPNGTGFELDIPAENATVTPTGNGQEINAQWGSVGSFHDSPDLKTWSVQFTAAQYGLSGSVVFESNGPHHYGCNVTDTSYFSGAVKGLNSLTSTEDLLFNQLGWATTIPGGKATVNLIVNGSPLQFTGLGYHDANWAPVPLNQIVTSWYFGSAQIGPYDFSYTWAQTIGNNSRALNTGYLSRDGVILQNQCSVDKTKTKDISIVTPYGLTTAPGGLSVPTGYIIKYILANGEVFSFNLTAAGANPDISVYHRWLGAGVGGKVIGADGRTTETYKGLAVFEWLNPGMNTYTPSN